MIKKITILCTTFCMIFALTVPQCAQAAENSISLDTVITEENFYDVLNYLGIDSSNVIETDGVINNDIQTVGDLKNVLDQVNEQCKNTINVNKKFNNEYSNSLFTNSLTTNSRSTNPTYGSILLTDTLDCDRYTVDFSASGNYRSSYWSGSNNIYDYHSPIWTSATVNNAVLNSNSLIPVYKIDSQSLQVNYNTSTITLSGTVVVGVYVGVLNELIRTTGQTINAHYEWDCYRYIS